MGAGCATGKSKSAHGNQESGKDNTVPVPVQGTMTIYEVKKMQYKDCYASWHYTVASTLKSINIKRYPVTEEYFKQRKEFMKSYYILPHEFHLVPAPIIMAAKDSTILYRRTVLRDKLAIRD